jgi:hypothetical protein
MGSSQNACTRRLRIENRSGPKKDSVSVAAGDCLKRPNRAIHRHGNFDAIHATLPQRLHGSDGHVRLRRPDDGDERDFFDPTDCLSVLHVGIFSQHTLRFSAGGSGFQLLLQLQVELYDFVTVENTDRLIRTGESSGLGAKLIIDIAAQIVKVIRTIVLRNVRTNLERLHVFQQDDCPRYRRAVVVNDVALD